MDYRVIDVSVGDAAYDHITTVPGFSQTPRHGTDRQDLADFAALA
ncbi:hypothetical protein [Nocardiopsis exhalans]|nr:hypothetical protein [Nocardiopsis exhalans]